MMMSRQGGIADTAEVMELQPGVLLLEDDDFADANVVTNSGIVGHTTRHQDANPGVNLARPAVQQLQFSAGKLTSLGNDGCVNALRQAQGYNTQNPLTVTDDELVLDSDCGNRISTDVVTSLGNRVMTIPSAAGHSSGSRISLPPARQLASVTSAVNSGDMSYQEQVEVLDDLNERIQMQQNTSDISSSFINSCK